jgi:hypothetical protein
MSNQVTNGEAVSTFSLVLSESERDLIGRSAEARGTSVANYLRSHIPELEVKQVGRPRKVLANENSPKSRRANQKKKQRKRRKLLFS